MVRVGIETLNNNKMTLYKALKILYTLLSNFYIYFLAFSANKLLDALKHLTAYTTFFRALGITVGGSCLYFLISYFLSKKLKLWEVTLKQKLNMDLLKQYFALDNCFLFRTNPGENLELLTTDSDKIFDFHANLRPSFFVACLASLYSGFLIYQQVAYLTFVFLIFALLQVLPGYIYKKYLVKFYLDARDVESRLSQWLLTAYDAFEEIVLGRKEDYFKQKKLLDNENIKVGVAAEFAYNLEVSISRLFSILLELVSYILLFYYLAK